MATGQDQALGDEDVPVPEEALAREGKDDRWQAAFRLAVTWLSLVAGIAVPVAVEAAGSGDFVGSLWELAPVVGYTVGAATLVGGIILIPLRFLNQEQARHPLTSTASEQASSLQVHVWNQQTAIREAIQEGRHGG